MKTFTTLLLALLSASSIASPTASATNLITSECVLKVPNGLPLCVDKKTTVGHNMHGWPCDQAKQCTKTGNECWYQEGEKFASCS